MVRTAQEVSVRLVRRSIVGDGGELIVLGISEGLGLSLICRLDLGTGLISRSGRLNTVQLRALSSSDDGTATGTRHIAVRGHQAIGANLGRVGHNRSVVGHLSVKVTDRGSSLCSRMVRTAQEVSVRLVRRSTRGNAVQLGLIAISESTLGQHTLEICVSNSSSIRSRSRPLHDAVGSEVTVHQGTCSVNVRSVSDISTVLYTVQQRALSGGDDGTATDARYVIQVCNTARGVNTVGHRTGIAAHVTRHIACKRCSHTGKSHSIAGTHSLADGHTAVGDRHTRTSGEVGAGLSSARASVRHHTCGSVVGKASVASSIRSAQVSACLGSAWTCISHHTCVSVVSKASVASSIRSTHSSAAAGIGVEQVGSTDFFRQVICIMVADVADRSGYVTRDPTTEGCSAREGRSSSDCEAVTHVDVICGDHIVTYDNITCSLYLSSGNGTDLKGSININVLKVGVSSHSQGRQYDHGHLRLGLNHAADGLIKVIVVLDLRRDGRRARRQVVNLTLKVCHI